MPIDTKRTYDAWSATYDADNPLNPSDVTFFEEKFVANILSILRPGLALDAGCGTGRHMVKLMSSGWKSIGFDQSKLMLEIAKEKLRENKRNGHGFIVCGNLMSTPFASSTFDLAICSFVLCHLEDQIGAILELSRIVQPGGILIITDILPFQSGPYPKQLINIQKVNYSFPNFYHSVNATLLSLSSAGFVNLIRSSLPVVRFNVVEELGWAALFRKA